jgi:hypothetical protein
VARTCIFCGGEPVTREHLWPDWVRRKVQIDAPFRYDMVEEEDGEDIGGFHFEQPPFDQTVRAVCARCNNGWMSAAESAVKPVLDGLLEYRGRRLHRREQRELATWALMKAAVFDALHRDRPAVIEAHRQHLYAEREPPPSGLWVWLATYNAEQVGHYAYQGVKLMPLNATLEPENPTAYIVTVTIGPVAVQLAGTDLLSLTFDDIVYPQLDVARVWPASGSVEYRQRVVMTTRTLHTFTTALYDDLMARATPAGPSAV